jgi:hypothetical protein
VKAKNLGMLFGTLLLGAGMTVAAPQAADQNAQNQGTANQQTTTQPSGTTQTTTTQTTAPPAATTTHKKLPRTASEAPLVGLAGIMALAAAAGLRFVNKRTA